MSTEKKYLSDRIADLAKAVAFHDCYFVLAKCRIPESVGIADGTPKVGDHKRLWEVVEELEKMSQDLEESCDWAEMRDQIWDEVTFDKDIKPEIFEAGGV